jgi:hypothetical protein
MIEEKPKTTVSIKEYEMMPFVYNDDGNINKLDLKVGDFYRMRDSGQIIDIGDRVSVYKVIRITPTGDESIMMALTIE